METSSEITKAAILAVMRERGRRTGRLWTASVVLDRLGVCRRGSPHARYSRRAGLRVRKLLRELHAEGALIIVKEGHTLQSATGTEEVAYGLAQPNEPSDGG